jgi:hypothetical protein
VTTQVPRTRAQERYGLSFDALILHCPAPMRIPPNPFRHEWERALEDFFADEGTRGRLRCPPELTIVTYSNYAEPVLLERCLSHLGIEEGVVVVGRGVRRWEWIHKVALVHELIASGGVRSEYVLCLDGDDVLLLGDPAEVVARWLATDSRLLFCGTRGDQPASPECWAFENSVHDDPQHRHLNAGGYIGETAYVGERLGEIVAAAAAREPWTQSEFGFDDQLAWRHEHRRRHPEIKVDADCRVFLRFDEDR